MTHKVRSLRAVILSINTHASSTNHNEWLEVPLVCYILYIICLMLITSPPLHSHSPSFPLNEDFLSFFRSHINSILHCFSLSPSFLKIQTKIFRKPCSLALEKHQKFHYKHVTNPSHVSLASFGESRVWPCSSACIATVLFREKC